ncbi:Retrovirus-related Pol polyprotein from transposon 412, partial [Araneus ventricosus]
MAFVILSPPTTRRGTYNPIMTLNTGDQQTAFCIQIENFNGEPDKLEWFIQQITDLKRINKWSGEMTFLFLKSKLAGSALS